MVGTERTRTVIEDPRLIAGYLREAILKRHLFVVEIGSNTIKVELCNIDESAARAKDGHRYLEFRLADRNPDEYTLGIWNELEIGTTVTFRVAYERMLLKFECSLESALQAGFRTRVPPLVTLNFHRKHHRFRASSISPNCTVVTVTNSQHSHHALFLLTDLSTRGIGGVIYSPIQISKDLENVIVGVIHQSSGSIPIEGTITRLEEVSKIGTFEYKVGLLSKGQQDITRSNSDGTRTYPRERRTTKRVTATFPIEIRSPLFPDATAVLQLDNVSMRGMKARIVNQSDRVLFREGIEVEMQSPKLALRVENIEGNSLTFAVLPGLLEEHIRLFNLICSFSEADVINSSSTPSDFLQLYAVSGSLSSSLARNQSLFVDQLQSSIHKSKQVAPWYLRWNQQSDEGQIRGTILTALYGDHVWYNGGLAGHLDPELKMSRDFVPRYYRNLADFFESLGNHEYLFFNWFTTNSWWDPWEDYLRSIEQSDTFYRFLGNIVYLRQVPSAKVFLQSQYSVKRLSRASPSEMDMALQNLSVANLRNLFRSLGLMPFSFGSRSLADILLKNGHKFSREFFSVKITEICCLVMISRFPIDVSPNGIINYPFVCAEGTLSAEAIDLLSTVITELARSEGVYAPAFFLTESGRSSSIQETSTITSREVVWTFSKPDILSFWRRK